MILEGGEPTIDAEFVGTQLVEKKIRLPVRDAHAHSETSYA